MRRSFEAAFSDAAFRFFPLPRTVRSLRICAAVGAALLAISAAMALVAYAELGHSLLLGLAFTTAAVLLSLLATKGGNRDIRDRVVHLLRWGVLGGFFGFFAGIGLFIVLNPDGDLWPLVALFQFAPLGFVAGVAVALIRSAVHSVMRA